MLVWLSVVANRPSMAEVALPRVFSDHMVLQRDLPVPVWGTAAAGEKVTVSFRGSTVSATAAADGHWRLALGPFAAGGPDALTVTASNTIEFRDVLVGEVWVCSGQSNMEWPMSLSRDPQADIQASTNPLLRLYTVRKATSSLPLDTFLDSKGHEWSTATPDAVKGFSAVAYYFGRDLQQALGVPVGLIHTSWGGSPAEAWTSGETLRSNPTYARDILEGSVSTMRNRKAALAKWEQDRDAAVAAGKNPPGKPFAGWLPSDLYHAMIVPLLPYGISGAIWYQGESNAGRAWAYRSLFADMIRDWRRAFAQGDFPFLAVQLAPWDKNRKRSIQDITREPVESDWAELREAQVHVSKVLPKVGVAVITDVGDKDDIHPNQKQPVGARLARLALRIAHGKDIAATGPVVHSHHVSQGAIVLNFDAVGSGLRSSGGDLTGFAIAGADRRWHWAKAEIRARNQVVVSSPSVAHPVAVRFGWADFPVVNLTDSHGLPASPFRTDDWPATTNKR